MNLCMFDFPINSSIMLPSETGFYYKFSGRNVFIRCIPLTGKNTFSYSNKDDLSNNEVKVNVSAISNKNKDAPVKSFFLSNQDGIYNGGFIEPKKFTRMQIYFEIDSIQLIKRENALKNIELWIASLLHDFIDLYRLHTNETDVVRPKLNDSSVIEILCADKYKFEPNIIEGNFKMVHRIFNWDNDTKAGHIKKLVTSEIMHDFASDLKTGLRPKIYQKLLLDAREQSLHREDHNLSVVITEIAFETSLKEFLYDFCSITGKQELVIGKGKDQKKQKYTEAIENSNVSDALNIINNIFRENFKGTKEYNDWYSHTYSKRNEIIHKGKFETNENDAKKAFIAATTFIDFIRSKFVNLLPNKENNK